ncbi:MAG: NAD-dependent protein deacylase [Deltaproteobacteria bacterium GWC2_42_11]|nr:MAG: NAD-dependent protein deacylase [Deltaproteobacteria bacterium GWC2_42_11]HBO84258.1 NAD-dependent protein deacylase [Deltaproteobacteria bacterium]
MRLSTPAKDAILSAKNVVALTGAGISAESGVPTFRGKDGLWRNFRPEELATPEAFRNNPKLVWEWYEWRRQIIKPLKPNKGHEIIARFENRFHQFMLITQNVDGLHQKAGSKNILELHGNIWRVKCTKENKTSINTEVPLPSLPPYCECGSILRPDVVWFGEPLPNHAIQAAYDAAGACDLMIVVGTSAVVQPAASLPIIAKQQGAFIVEVNAEETPISHIADEFLIGKAGVILKEFEI